MRKSHTVTELMISFCLLWHNCRCVLFTWLQNWCDTPLQMHSVCMVQPVRDASPIINVIVFELIQSKHFVNVTHEIYVDCWHMIYLLTTGARYKHWCSIWTLLTTCRAIVENWPVSTHKGKKSSIKIKDRWKCVYDSKCQLKFRLSLSVSVTSDLGATFKNLPQKIRNDVYKPGGTGLSHIADQKTREKTRLRINMVFDGFPNDIIAVSFCDNFFNDPYIYTCVWIFFFNI